MSLIIAEAGHNHNGKMEMAKELIYAAKESGADVVKFQLYDTEKILSQDHPWYWDLARSRVNEQQWMQIVEWCREVGIEYLASVFDTDKVDWCQRAGVMRYKIASRSIYDMELLEKVVTTGKDVIMSLGMVDQRGIPKPTVPVNFYYLYCVAKYPAPLSKLRLSHVDFTQYAGLSDHSIGIEAAMVAIARGAKIIEKHFTLDKNLDGCDHAGSMEPEELKRLVDFARKYEELK